MAVTEYTSAISGSGKTYRRCAHFLATEFLPLRKGRIWTNFPIHIDEMVAYVVANHPELVASDIRDRIRLIPDDVLAEWRMGKSGPWDYFKDQDLAGDRIAIDEIHNYCASTTDKKTIVKWQEFLGELRHRGTEIEVISQNDPKVHAAIRNEAGLKRDLFNTEQRRDFIFGILMSDWYNLRAKFISGKYTACVFEYERVAHNGKWHLQNTVKFHFQPEFFKLYDSYSTPIAGGTKARAPSHPYLDKTHTELVRWFVHRNWFNLSWRGLLICGAIWLCFLGGASHLINGFMSLQKSMYNGNHPQAQSTDKTEAKSSQVRPPGAPAVVSPSGDREPFRDDPQYQDIERQLLKARDQVAGLEKKVSELEAKLERGNEVIMITPNYAILRSGLRVYVNGYMPFGPYEKYTVKAIDHENRQVVLSNGAVLRMASK